MATLGLLASWAAALFGGWAFVGGLATVAPGHPVRRSSERALLAAALAALAASVALLALLLDGDVTISYVARSLTRNLPRLYRYAALWNLPAGAVLPTAALVAGAGWLAARRARSSLGVAATGAIVMALCAASLAATPFAILPWVPADGIGLAPGLQHPLSVVGRLALSLAVASAAADVARAADRLADPTAPHFERPGVILMGTMALLALAMWTAAGGAFATGVDASAAPLTAWRGTLVPAGVALVLAWTARAAAPTAAFATAIGALGLGCAVLLGATRGAASGWAASLLPLLSLGAAALGALVAALGMHAFHVRAARSLAVLLLAAGAATALWLPDPSLAWLAPATQWLLAAGGVVLTVLPRGSTATASLRASAPIMLASVGALLAWLLSPELSPVLGWGTLAGAAFGAALVRGFADGPPLQRLPEACAALAVAFAAIGAMGEGAAVTSSASLGGGASTTVVARFAPPLTVVHQGISRYEDGNAHVEAVALELMRGDRSLGLLSADRREFVDGRDEVLGAVTMRPATAARPLETLRIRVDDIAADERVMLRVTVVPFPQAWLAALVCLVLAALLSIIRWADRPALPDSAGLVAA